MDDAQPATIPTPRTPSKKLRVPVSKQHAVKALLDQKIPYRSVREITGLSATTIAKISRQEIASSEQVEKIKKGLRGRFAAIADSALTALDDTKLSEASAKDLIYIAHKSAEMALGGTPSIVETYSQTLKAFMQSEDTTTGSVPGEIVKTVTITKTDTA